MSVLIHVLFKMTTLFFARQLHREQAALGGDIQVDMVFPNACWYTMHKSQRQEFSQYMGHVQPQEQLSYRSKSYEKKRACYLLVTPGCKGSKIFEFAKSVQKRDGCDSLQSEAIQSSNHSRRSLNVEYYQRVINDVSNISLASIDRELVARDAILLRDYCKSLRKKDCPNTAMLVAFVSSILQRHLSCQIFIGQ